MSAPNYQDVRTTNRRPIIRIETAVNTNGLSGKFDTKKTSVVSMGRTLDYDGVAVRYIDVSGSLKDVKEIIALLDETLRGYITNVTQMDTKL